MKTLHPDWPAADKAYQHHHSNCATCIAAGASPNTQTRCATGQDLWDAYINAGDPPHITWVAREKARNERLQKQAQRGRRPNS